MLNTLRLFLFSLLLIAPLSAVHADEYQDTISIFRNAGESNNFFDQSYGYAVFPTIGKGGIIVGGAYGEGRVYKQGTYVGDTSMTQASIGLQLGGQAFSQIIFFQDQRAFDEFTSGNFEFGADASVVAITAAANGSADDYGQLCRRQWWQERCNNRCIGLLQGYGYFHCR